MSKTELANELGWWERELSDALDEQADLLTEGAEEWELLENDERIRLAELQIEAIEDEMTA